MPQFIDGELDNESQNLRFDDSHSMTTPGNTSSQRDEPDAAVLNGPRFRGRCSTIYRELLQNPFDEKNSRIV